MTRVVHKPLLDVRPGDWVIFKHDPQRTWYVEEVFPRGVLNDDSEPRVIVSLYDAFGVMGANRPWRSIQRVANQRELLLSAQFRWGFPRQMEKK